MISQPRNTLLLVVVAVAMAALLACASQPEADRATAPATAPESMPSPPPIDMFDAGNTSAETEAAAHVTGPMVEDNDPETPPLEPREGEQVISRTIPTDLASVDIADDGILGAYLPTVDYTRAEDYALMIFEHNEQLQWVLARHRNDDSPGILGFGTLQQRPGGLEFVELQRQDDNTVVEVGVQSFPAWQARNRFTIGQKAGVDRGEETAIGKVMAAFGTEVHWIRTTVSTADGLRLPTAPVIGSFNPLTAQVPDRDALTVDRSRFLTVWPDGQWRMVEDVEAGSRLIFGGTWELQADGQSMVFTQSIPPDPQRGGDDPASEQFRFGFDADKQILWLTKTHDDPHGSTAVLPRRTGDTHTVVWVTRRETAER